MNEVIAKILSNSNGSRKISQKKHTEFGVLSLRVNSEGVFYDPQKVVLHKSQSPVKQALFYTSLKSPQGLRRLVDFLGIKKPSQL
jgi:hypothetical protein